MISRDTATCIQYSILGFTGFTVSLAFIAVVLIGAYSRTPDQQQAATERLLEKAPLAITCLVGTNGAAAVLRMMAERRG